MSAADLTYSEAVELGAVLYCGQRMAEMAISGAYGMPRVTGADVAPMAAVAGELRELDRAVTTVTRRGLDQWRPADLVAALIGGRP